MQFVPRVHGNGFIQLDLTPSKRLHIWGHPNIPKQKTETPIHDHTFGFTSRILLGSLLNVVYDVHDVSNGGYMIHRARVRDKEDTILEPTGQRVHLTPRDAAIVHAGSSYIMHPLEIHESVPRELTVSIITKTGATLAQGGPSPRVFVPVDTKPDNAFNRYTADQDTLWAIIADVLTDARVRTAFD